MNDLGLVSIIMPNFNCGKYIGESIQSVLSQTYPFFELIIVDDCSTDNSTQVIKEYCLHDKRIKLIVNKENRGAAISRNTAIKIASGRFIAFLDSDDIWLPNKLEKQIAFMCENGYAFTFAGVSFMNESSEDLGKGFIPSKSVYTYRDILKRNEIGCLTAVYDTKLIGKFLMPENAIKREDYACFLNILKKADGFSIQEVNAKYRIHKSVSSNKIKMIKYTWNVYRKVEGISLFKSFFYMLCWALYGIKKYNKKLACAQEKNK